MTIRTLAASTLIALSFALAAPALAGECSPQLRKEVVLPGVTQQVLAKGGTITEYDEATSEAIVTELGEKETDKYVFIFVNAVLDGKAYWGVFRDGCFFAQGVEDADFAEEFIKKAIAKHNV